MNTKNKISISKRYANSLLKLSKENREKIDTLKSELLCVKEILNSSPELQSALLNPTISIQDKKEITERVFERDTSEELRKFLKLIIEKGRFGFIHSIIDEFFEIADIKENISRIEIVSAIELNDEQKRNLEEKFSQKSEKKLIFKYSKDESLIAGLMCKIGDKVIDTSLSCKLKEFRKELIKK